MGRNRVIAVFGASENPAKYGYKILSVLLKKGFDACGVNPKGGMLDGRAFYASLAAVPAAVHTAIMVIPPAALEEAVRQCVQGGVKEIWFQPGAQSAQAFEAARNAGINAIDGCYMAANGLW